MYAVIQKNKQYVKYNKKSCTLECAPMLLDEERNNKQKVFAWHGSQTVPKIRASRS